VDASDARMHAASASLEMRLAITRSVPCCDW
jgi:hypothetical protein